jgi:multiple sugar transport system permease protein
MHVLLVPFIVFALFPFYHMTLTSLKTDRELYDRTAIPLLITQGPTLEHYTKLLWESAFLTWTKNSLLVTFLATAVSLVLGTIAAYALARLKFFAVGSFGTGIFVTYLVPTSLLFLPLAQVVNWLGLADSKWALVVTYPTFLVPFCTWLLMGYFRTVPKEIEECAMVDGATRIQALWRIVLPIAVPGLVATFLITLVLAWNEYIIALILSGANSQTMPLLVAAQNATRGPQWWAMSVLVLIMIVPVTLMAIVLERYISRGLLVGALKG